LTRQQDIKDAVHVGATRWLEQSGQATRDVTGATPFYEPVDVDPDLLAAEEVLLPIPRREPLTSTAVSQIAPPRLRLTAPFHAGFWLTLRRAMLWLRSISMFLFGVLFDRLRGIDSPRRRAVRLRETIVDRKSVV
jgi:hypothetical protein